MPLDTSEFGQVMHYYFEKSPEVLVIEKKSIGKIVTINREYIY